MGNTCCNERGDGESQAIKINKPAPTSAQPKEDTKQIIPLTKSELNHESQAANKGPDFEIPSTAEIEAFAAHPSSYLGIKNDKIKEAIKKHGFYKLTYSHDSRIPYFKAELITSNGKPYRYFGQMDKTSKEGRGQLYFLEEDGHLVISNFNKDMAEGEGAVYFPNGDYFVGTLAANQMAQGTLYQENGNKYYGTFANNLFHGAGTYSMLDGRMYKGQFKNGKKEGHGVFNWVNGDLYDGEWKNGKQHGFGAFTQGGKKFEGQFLEGKKIKQNFA